MSLAAARARLPGRCSSPATASTAAGSRASSRSTTRAPTPAHARDDGVDFVPTPPFYLFGSTSRRSPRPGRSPGRSSPARPSAGCRACSGSASAWCFIGAVHDFSSLVASVRHGGALDRRDRARAPRAAAPGCAMMAFIWIALVYVIVAFADITAGTFVAGTEELRRRGAALPPRRRGGGGERPLPAARARAWAWCSASSQPPLWLVTRRSSCRRPSRVGLGSARSSRRCSSLDARDLGAR